MTAPPGPDAPARRAPWRHRLALVAFALVATLVAAEVALQLASAVARRAADRSGDAALGGDAITILCVGDSHTFGLPLPEEDSYPAQLGRALAARHPQLRFRVVNLGLPSLNSAFVANRLERQLFQLRPHVVVAWVGINNLWNLAERETGGGGGFEALRRALFASRLVRLASIAWHRSVGPRIDADRRGGSGDPDAWPVARPAAGEVLGDPAPGLARDLERMARLTRAVDTPIVFVTYPPAEQAGINRIIVETGGRLGVPVVETSRDLRRAAEAGHTREQLVDYRAGPHPSALLYQFIVESLVREVEALLRAWHGLPVQRPPAS